MTRVVRLGCLLGVVAAATWYGVFSAHWRITSDTPVMHYVVFLLRHGFRPYAQITDNNLPGAYLTEAAAMRVFGPSDLGWRLYEWSLLAGMAAAMGYLSRRVDWIAGVFAAGVFMALHASEGPQFAAERELVVTVLLLAATAALSAGLEDKRVWPVLGAGLMSAVAASIKPTFALYLPLAVAAVVLSCRRQRQPMVKFLVAFLGGYVAVVIACVGFLVWYRVVGSFVFVLTRVIPAYAGMKPPAWGVLLRAVLPRALLALVLWTAPLAWLHWRSGRAEGRLERWVVGGMALLGLFSFLVQRKGFPHHRYTLVACLLLLVSTELFRSLGRSGFERVWAAVALAALLFWFIPKNLLSGARIPAQTELYAQMRGDLQALGGARTLQGKVFCFDLVYGCLNALYHEGLVENMPSTGDLLFFPPRDNAATEYYRDRFWAGVKRDPPAVLIVSNEDLGLDRGYQRLTAWPEFSTYLGEHYREVVQRRFPHEKFGVHVREEEIPPGEQDGYRIYVRDGSPLLHDAEPRLLPSGR